MRFPSSWNQHYCVHNPCIIDVFCQPLSPNLFNLEQELHWFSTSEYWLHAANAGLTCYGEKKLHYNAWYKQFCFERLWHIFSKNKETTTTKQRKKKKKNIYLNNASVNSCPKVKVRGMRTEIFCLSCLWYLLQPKV